MKLHENKEIFSDAIRQTSEHFKIDPSIILKDYYVTLFLRELNEEIGGLIFKGGTSLSKCCEITKRFSEDADLAINPEQINGQKKIRNNK
ncbi:MAG TPA: nucleotidyl transferase AbiEii/AbiGii toxin family protein [Bacilli bacterium]|nr:nucleotidyl transferase AbiEii/AbiGii toxin family protein [Bacilli bacterium]HPS18770.1 nucleotidyl transferase AbiEii/AbiGii toxin family protein [Bacilli bacterium]